MEKLLFIFCATLLLFSCNDKNIITAMEIEGLYDLSRSEQVYKYGNLSEENHYRIWKYKYDNLLLDNYWNKEQKEEIQRISDALSVEIFRSKIPTISIDENTFGKKFTLDEASFLVRSINGNYVEERNSMLKGLGEIESEIGSDRKPICSCNEYDNGLLRQECREQESCAKSLDCKTSSVGCGFWWLKACDGECG